MRNDRIDLKEAAEPSGLFSAARRRSIRSRHELGLTQSCEVRRLIVQIQRKNKAKTKRFILAYRLINFATPSVAFDLHVNLKYNYSKWRRFCTSSARPKILMALRLWNPRDRYPIVPMEPTPAEIRVAFSFVERNNICMHIRTYVCMHACVRVCMSDRYVYTVYALKAERNLKVKLL